VRPRDFALIMVSIGLVALVMATIAHRKEVRGLAQELDGRRSRAQIVAALVSVFGLVVLFSAILHG
jgi:hypothetical protein